MKKISIGIPLFNEGKSIHQLLISLLQQQHVSIKEIILATDGSTDNTILEIKKVFDKRIKMINGNKRMGKAYRMQQIISVFSGDVLVFLDGDIQIKDNEMFSEILKKYPMNTVSLIGVRSVPEKTGTLFQRFLLASMTFQDYIKRTWKHGDNYLAFKGNMLFLEKTFGKSITFPENLVNDDAYIYFLAKVKKLRSVYAHMYTVWYTLPSRFEDHVKQSARFSSSKKELMKYFSNEIIDYTFPKKIMITSFLKTLIKEHIYFIGYIFVMFLVRTQGEKKVTAKWSIAKTTKGAFYV